MEQGPIPVTKLISEDLSEVENKGEYPLEDIPKNIPITSRTMSTYKFLFSDNGGCCGSSKNYSIWSEDICLFDAKFEKTDGKYDLVICPISCDVGESKSFTYMVLHDDKKANFTIRSNDSLWEELMIVLFKPSPIEHAPRLVTIRFKKEINGVPSKLKIKKPKINSMGEWTYKHLIPNILSNFKNCYLEDENGKDQMVFLLTEKNEAIVQANPAIPPEFAFAFGICSFMSTIQ